MVRIYTGTGDEGETGLWGGLRVSKTHPRVVAYGTIDELNAHIGLAVALMPDSTQELAEQLRQVQDDLFVIGSQLARPADTESQPPTDAGPQLPVLQTDAVSRLEDWIDGTDVPPLNQFILPGGHRAAAQLHVCRAVSRRAERACVRLTEESPVSAVLLTYLNRLSDYLFTAARWVNHQRGIEDTPWQR